MPVILNRYIKYENDGDHFVDKCVSGRSQNSKRFGASCVYRFFLRTHLTQRLCLRTNSKASSVKVSWSRPETIWSVMYHDHLDKHLQHTSIFLEHFPLERRHLIREQGCREVLVGRQERYPRDHQPSVGHRTYCFQRSSRRRRRWQTWRRVLSRALSLRWSGSSISASLAGPAFPAATKLSQSWRL